MALVIWLLILMLLTLHFLLGYLFSLLTYDIHDIDNPLWKILFVSAWFTAAIYLTFMKLYEYIIEVKEWFEEREANNE